MKAKYIIIRKAKMEMPMVFSQFLLHSEVAGKSQITSAGFCEVTGAGKWRVGGQSTSLKLTARLEDAEILNTHLLKDAFEK